MAVDPSIQLFSYELFNHLWLTFGETSRVIPTCTTPESLNVESHVTSEILEAVCCRHMIFQQMFYLQFEHTNIAFCNSPSDFLAHLCVAFGDKSFTELKVFDRVIATCAFTVGMSMYCSIKGNKLFLKDDFLCWAMYFDTELKSTFYEQGGWKVLKRVAKSYVLPFLALRTLNTKPYLLCHDICKFMSGVDDFCYFQTFQDQENQTCAKSWMDFRLRNAKNPRRNTFKDIKSLEEFLTCFKFLCDPLGERVLEDSVHSHKEDIFFNFKGNEYLETLSMKLSNFHLSYPTKQNYCFQDGLLTSPTPEVFQGTTDPEKDLMSIQASGIDHPYKDKCVDHALTTKLSPLKNLNDSQISKSNGDVSKGITEDEFKRLWREGTENNDSDDVQIDNRAVINFVLQKSPIDVDSLLETINTENNTLLKDNKPVHQNLKENNYWFLELLPMYESMKNAMKVNSIQAVLSHASVFMADNEIIHTGNEFAPNKTCPFKAIENVCVVKNETSQMIKAASLEGQEIQNGAKNKKKKKKKSGKSASPLEHETFTDDTKDILRMVLVLGCQPSLNYIRSTIKQA